MQKFISWNVASVRARLPLLLSFLKEEQPDIMMIQEVKATSDTFPALDILIAGYQTVLSGQKGFNGVAILSKQTMNDPLTALPGFQDTDPPQARFCQAETPDGITCICVYVPNGNPPEKNPADTERLAYKLRWMTALTHHVSRLSDEGKKIILGGDFNVIERDTDVYNPEAYRTNALMLPAVRKAFSALSDLPITNAVRLFNPEPHTYSFWDFQMGAWPKNNGMLLDAVFVSNNLKNRLSGATVYKHLRGVPKPSDHVPVGCVLKD